MSKHKEFIVRILETREHEVEYVLLAESAEAAERAVLDGEAKFIDVMDQQVSTISQVVLGCEENK